MFLRLRYRTFTLIEMLVVIAIIGILAALLMPALQKSLEQARTIQCLSNQRNMSAVFYLYSEDNSGLFPPATMQYLSNWHFTNGWERFFTNLCGPYVGYPEWYSKKYGDDTLTQTQLRSSVFTCPANPSPDVKSDFGLFKTGFGYNVRLPRELENSSSGSWPPFASGTARAANIRSPGTIGHVSDKFRGFHLAKDGVTIDKIYDRTANVDLTRHLGGANMLFADGHAKSYHAIEFVDSFNRAYRLQK